ncbi:hypothetical protein FRX31_033607, partial [Thalictrum thalictroides]
KEVLEEMPTSIGEPPDEDIFVTIVRGLGRARMNRKAIKGTEDCKLGWSKEGLTG